jgi:DNA-binding FadR family transcriptional regulator
MEKKPFGSFKSFKRENISTEIMNMVMDHLLSKKLRPGDKLPTEAEFAEQLNVGRNSLREAIKMLVSLGIVEVRRGVGTFIADSISASSFNPLVISLVFNKGKQEDLTELRYFFEVAVAELVIEKAKKEDIDKLIRINENIRVEGDANIERIRELDMEFHKALLSAAQNPFFEKLGIAIIQLFYSSVGASIHGDSSTTYHNHKMIIDAIKTKDRELIRKNVWISLAFWREHLGAHED